MTERLNGSNGHNEGALIVNPKDQVDATTRKDISLICGDCKAETGDDIFFVRSERRRPNSHQLKPKE